jgi:hypothetical protein
MPNNSDALISLAKEVFSDLTEAEESFFRLNAIGDYPVFGDGSSDLDKPEKADEWGPERTIRADCLRWLCLAQAARPLIVGIRLRAVGAKIQGLLQLDYSLIPFVLAFDRSCFTDWITFEKSRLVGLEITGTRLKKSIYAAGLGVSGSIQIWNESVVEGQLFFDAMYPSRFASRNIALTALRSWFVVVAEAFCATRYLNSTNAVSVTEARSRSAEGPRNSMRNPEFFCRADGNNPRRCRYVRFDRERARNRSIPEQAGADSARGFQGVAAHPSTKNAGCKYPHRSERRCSRPQSLLDDRQNAGMSSNCRSSLCESFKPGPNFLAPLLTAPKKRS